MKNYIFVILAVCLFLSSCIKDKSPVITQSFDMDEFTGVTLSISGNVRIVDGDVQEVEITGPEETVSKITKKVESGIWDINFPSNFNKTYDELEIIIRSDNIKELNISGSGDIITENTLTLSSINISGSGRIDAYAQSSEINSEISGSGDIRLTGEVETLNHNTSGSGNLKAYDLETTSVFINISGSGDAEVYVTKNLIVDISGSGNVFYKGNPDSISSRISGSGEIINAN